MSTNSRALAKSAYPAAVGPECVGTYPSEKSRGALFNNALEYRVWFYSEGGGDDKYAARVQYEPAESFSKTAEAEEPVVLVRQESRT